MTSAENLNNGVLPQPLNPLEVKISSASLAAKEIFTTN
jgi:hypothetical protein